MYGDSDVHYKIVKARCDDAFDSEETIVEFNRAGETRTGPGRVTADSAAIIGAMMYIEDFPPPGESRTLTMDDILGKGSRGVLLPEERFGTLRPVAETQPRWLASKVLVESKNFSMGIPLAFQTRFMILESRVTYNSGSDVSFTREVFVGVTVPGGLGAQTIYDDGSMAADRVEGKLFGRRVTLRNLHDTTAEQDDERLAIVYDGEPLDDKRSEILWLTISLLSGNFAQPSYVETYDSSGTLLERLYRPGRRYSPRLQAPFHVVYAPFDWVWLEEISSGLERLASVDFPIDVVLAHIHDAVDGAIERQMQSLIFSIHTAIEAWNRHFEVNTIIGSEKWADVKHHLISSAVDAAKALSDELARSVDAKLSGANSTSTGERQRRLFQGLRIILTQDERRALKLRNSLFHDGYFQRRLQHLDRPGQQARYDDLFCLRDLSYRVLFGLIQFTGRWQAYARSASTISVH